MKSQLPYTTELLITELHDRGVSIETIFAQYYALEAIADAKHDEVFGDGEDGQHGITVNDALLAVPLFTKPSGVAPF